MPLDEHDENLDLDAADLSRPFVDFLILADYVETANGKLYMMGGGWENYTVPEGNRPVRFGVAIAIMVPWSATNEQHALSLRIEDADGRVVTPSMTGEFQVGRPAVLPPGAEQRILWALNGDFALPVPGEYRLIAAIDGEDSEWTSFRLVTAPPQGEPRGA
jgi:hypothetical protein